MKKTSLFTAACVITLPALSQSLRSGATPSFLQSAATATTISLLDSTYEFNNWNSGTNTWNSRTKYAYRYNSFNKQNAESMYDLTSGVWKNTRNGKNYVFDASHNLLEKIYENLAGSTWVDNSKETSTFDASNNMLTKLVQTKTSGSWVNSVLSTYTYAGNKVTSTINQTWNSGSGSWENSKKNITTYNTSDQVISHTEQNWISGTWVNYSRSTNIVYSGNDLVSYEVELWDTSTSSYVPDSKVTQSFNGNHHLTGNLTEIWNSGTSSWENYLKLTRTSDALDNTTSMLIQLWFITSVSWTNAFSETYFYRTGYVGVDENQVSKNTVSVFPNPATNHINVSSPGSGGSTHVLVSDLSGKTVLSTKAEQASPFNINIQALEAGMYFIELTNKEGSTKGKFIKN